VGLTIVLVLAAGSELMKHRRSSIACTTAAMPPTAGQLVTSERGVCGGPLALLDFHYVDLVSHIAACQSLACDRPTQYCDNDCVRPLYQLM
jgi:hypothetical protein